MGDNVSHRSSFNPITQETTNDNYNTKNKDMRSVNTKTYNETDSYYKNCERRNNNPRLVYYEGSRPISARANNARAITPDISQITSGYYSSWKDDNLTDKITNRSASNNRKQSRPSSPKQKITKVKEGQIYSSSHLRKNPRSWTRWETELEDKTNFNKPDPVEIHVERKI